MNWKHLTSPNQLQEIKENSKSRPQLIFKHSIRCSISSMAKGRLERSQQPENIDFYILDLINNRSLSNKLAEEFNVWHESPQILLIPDGKCPYDERHTATGRGDV